MADYADVMADYDYFLLSLSSSFASIFYFLHFLFALFSFTLIFFHFVSSPEMFSSSPFCFVFASFRLLNISCCHYADIALPLMLLTLRYYAVSRDIICYCCCRRFIFAVTVLPVTPRYAADEHVAAIHAAYYAVHFAISRFAAAISAIAFRFEFSPLCALRRACFATLFATRHAATLLILLKAADD